MTTTQSFTDEQKYQLETRGSISAGASEGPAYQPEGTSFEDPLEVDEDYGLDDFREEYGL